MATPFQEADLICNFGPYEGHAKLIERRYSGDRAMVAFENGAPPLRRGNPPSDFAVRWISISLLSPAECTCRPDGPACRACQDWHALKHDDEIPF